MSLLKTGRRWSSTPGEWSSGSLLKNEPMEEVGDWLRLQGGLGLSKDSDGLRAAGLDLEATAAVVRAFSRAVTWGAAFWMATSSWLCTKWQRGP